MLEIEDGCKSKLRMSYWVTFKWAGKGIAVFIYILSKKKNKKKNKNKKTISKIK